MPIHYVTNQGALSISRGDWDDDGAGGFYLGLLSGTGVPAGISTKAAIIALATPAALLAVSGVVEPTGGWYSRKTLSRSAAATGSSSIRLAVSPATWSTTSAGVKVYGAFIAREKGTDSQDELTSVIIFDQAVTLDGTALSLSFSEAFRLSGNDLPDPPAAPSGTPPVAAFTKSVVGLAVTVNGSSSSDADGSIVSYAWNFGDGATATGVAPATQTYAAAGTYTITLTVTDNQGLTGTTTQSVTVTTVGAGNLINETFSTGSVAGDANFVMLQNAISISGGTIKPSALNAYTDAYHSLDLGSVSHWVEAQVIIGASDTGSYWGINVRQATSGYTYYHLQIQPGRGLVLMRVVNGAVTTLGTYATGWALSSTHTLKLQANGTQIVAYADGVAVITVYDGSIPEGSHVGVWCRATTSVTNVVLDNFKAGLVEGGVPGNLSPIASFTKAITNQTVTLNGTGSSDPDGSIATYAWNFGDGTTANTATYTKTYGAAGTYTITLTVTDNQGATGSTSQTVTITTTPGATTSLPAKILGGYYEHFDVYPPPNTPPTDIPTEYNVIFHAFVNTASDGSAVLTTGSTISNSALASYYATVQASGKPVIVSVGGWTGAASGLSDPAHRTNFLNTVIPIINQFGFSGLDWDLEHLSGSASDIPGGISVTGLAEVSRALKAHFGSNFIISMAPASFNTSEYRALAQNLQATGDLDLVMYQFYNLGYVPTGAQVLAEINAWISYIGNGITASKFIIGMWHNNWGGSDVVPYSSMTSWWNTVKAALPTIRGVMTWGITETDKAEGWAFVTTMAPLVFNYAANTPPVASFTKSISGLTVSLDASASYDPDGTIASYSWNYGDGTTATGVSKTKVFSAAGTYTITLTVTDNQGATTSTSQSTTVTAPGGGGGGGGPLPAKVVAGYTWNVLPGGLPANYNLLLHAFAQVAGDGAATMWQGYDSTIASQYAARKAAGKPTILSVGGAGGAGNTLATLAAQNRFVATIVPYIDFYGFQGIDWDLEASVSGGSVDGQVSISRRLRQLYGPDFMISMAPYGGTSAVYKEVAKQLWSTGDLTYVGYQHYNDVTQNASTLIATYQEWQSYIGGGFDPSHWVLGMWYGPWDWHPTGTFVYTWSYSAMVASFNGFKAVYPTVRGVYTWGIPSTDASGGYQFGITVGNAVLA